MNYTLSYTPDEVAWLKRILRTHRGLSAEEINPLINTTQRQIDEQDARVKREAQAAASKAASASAKTTADAIAAERAAAASNGEAAG